MPSSPWTKVFVFIGVALSHASLVGGLVCLGGASPTPPENFILLELVSEPKPEAEPEPEPETEASAEAAAVEVAGDEVPAETSPAAEASVPEPPPPASPESIPEYQLEETHDSASGNDGIIHGDAPDAGEKIEVLSEPDTPAEAVPEPTEAEAGIETPEKEAAAKQIGKQGDATATREGEFGSGGSGGNSADATVRYRHRVAPKYPRTDARAGRTGTVVLLLEIDENGELLSVRVKRSAGSRTLDAAAVQAARASKYFPAHNGERPVASRAEASYTFAR